MNLSILFYNIVVIFSFFSAFISVRYKNLFLLALPFILIFTVSAFRQGVGTDFYSYKDYFNAQCLNCGREGELLFYSLNIMLKSIDLDFQWVIITTSFIFCIFITACAKTKFGVWFFLFILLNLYLPTFNIIRQGVAVSIVCYAVYRYFYFDEKKLYVALLFVATMFHTSLIVGVVVLIFDKVKLSNWFVVLIIIVFYVFAGQLVTIFLDYNFLEQSRYSNYIGTDYLNRTKVGTGIGVLLQLFPFFLMMLCNVRLFGTSARSIFIRNACFFFILVKIMVLHLFILNRLEVAVIFLTALIFCESARLCRKSYFNLFVFTYMLIWQVLQFELMLNNGLHEVIPYMSIMGGL